MFEFVSALCDDRRGRGGCWFFSFLFTSLRPSSSRASRARRRSTRRRRRQSCQQVKTTIEKGCGRCLLGFTPLVWKRPTVRLKSRNKTRTYPYKNVNRSHDPSARRAPTPSITPAAFDRASVDGASFGRAVARSRRSFDATWTRTRAVATRGRDRRRRRRRTGRTGRWVERWRQRARRRRRRRRRRTRDRGAGSDSTSRETRSARR